MPTQTPTLAEVFDAAMHHRMRESFGGWMPARVESYDLATNRAVVQVLVYDDYEDEEGERQTEPFPPLTDVPVCFLSLGGKFVIRSTVAAGDEGLYMAPARPTGKWLQTGGMVDPEDDSHHDINGGVFLPYRLSAGGSNGNPMIEITSTEIHAGGSSALALASELQDLKSKYNLHTHTGNGVATVAPFLVTASYAGTTKLKGGFVHIGLLFVLALVTLYLLPWVI